jgi:hypothetical protein
MLLAMGGFKVDGWVKGEGKRNGWIGGQRECNVTEFATLRVD